MVFAVRQNTSLYLLTICNKNTEKITLIVSKTMTTYSEHTIRQTKTSVIENNTQNTHHFT